MIHPMLKKPVLFLIRLYQKTFSLDHGPLKKYVPFGACRFQPTCSEYTYQAVQRFGILKGLYLGSRRVLKCHPFHPGGIDEVPKK